MNFKKVLIIYLALVSAQPDGCEFFCTCDGASVLCVDINIFPPFEISALIESIIIVDSSLSELVLSPALFPSLQSVTLRNTPLLDCHTILEIIESGVSVESDVECVNHATTEARSDVSGSTSSIRMTVSQLSAIETSTTDKLLQNTEVIARTTDELSTVGNTIGVSEQMEEKTTEEITVFSTFQSPPDTEHTTSFQEITSSESNHTTTIVAVVISAATLLLLIGIVLGGIYCYYRANRNEVTPLGARLDMLELDTYSCTNPVYESTTM